MQNARTNFEAGFALLKIPFSQTPYQQVQPGTADMFKKASVLQDSNVGYAMNAHETNVKR